MRRPCVRLTVRWLAVAVLFLGWLALPYTVSRYQGDGTITDRGFWSYPRYRIRLPQMELAAGRPHVYRLRGLPPESLYLTFEVVGRRLVDDEDFDAMRTGKTWMAVTIADDRGRRVCSASGALKEWVLTQSYQHASYWHDGCVRPELNERTAYTMTVTVGGESATPQLVIVPTLEGGGMELP
ncbi:hypothetical protein V5E97_37570 [Singulisphaera sp. Ch08]|uniref:Uncharacterized protein n=1 Tax=Singulisphaera sp. Ch08 TaxID=3120278 RepID=A0AAU7CET5_9BACT